jgi:hypothetical protein
VINWTACANALAALSGVPVRATVAQVVNIRRETVGDRSAVGRTDDVD